MKDPANTEEICIHSAFYREFLEYLRSRRKSGLMESDEILREAYFVYRSRHSLEIPEIQRIRLRAIITMLKKEGLISKAQKRDFLNILHPGPQVLPAPIISRLFSENGCSTLDTALMTLYGTGIRVSELIDLRVLDLNHHDMILNIQCKRSGRQRKAFYPKQIHYRLIHLLPMKKPEDPLFSLQSRYGEHAAVSEITLRKYFSAKLGKAGLGQTGLSCLRDSFAVHLLIRGIREEFLSENMGMTVKNFRRRYWHYMNAVRHDNSFDPDLLPGLSS